MIINLPKNLERDTTHRYGPNTFKLHRRVNHARALIRMIGMKKRITELSSPC